MRIGSTIILLNGYCYQSYFWKLLRPLGELQRVLDSLEAYHCDEISLIRPIRVNDTDECFQKDIDTVKKINCMTPLSFGGGLRSCKNIEILGELPIERLILTSAFIHKNLTLIDHLRKRFGHQAIQCLLPFTIEDDLVKIFAPSQNTLIPLDSIDLDFIDAYANEVILYDITHESQSDRFDEKIIKKLSICNEKLIISGGIGRLNIQSAKKKNIASVLIDNKVLHKEYSIKGYKDG